MSGHVSHDLLALPDESFWGFAEELPVGLVRVRVDGTLATWNVRARDLLDGLGGREIEEALGRVVSRARRNGSVAEQALSVGRLGEVRLVAIADASGALVALEHSTGTRLRTEIRVLREFIAAVGEPVQRRGPVPRALDALAGAIAGARIAYYVVDGDELVHAAESTSPPQAEPFAVALPTKMVSSSVARAVRTGQPVFVPDLHRSPLADDRRSLGGVEQAGLAVPVRAAGSVRGALWVIGPPHLLGEGELRLVQALTDTLGELLWRGSQEDALLRAQRDRRELVDELPDALLELDADGTILQAGGTTAHVFGCTPQELEGRAIRDWLAPADVAGILDRLSDRHRPYVEMPGPAGRRLKCAVDRIGADQDGRVRLLVRDLTERFELEDRVRRERETSIREQQLASVGRLAAGVAHEVNNPLTYVRANLQLLGERISNPANLTPDDASDIALSITECIEGIDRISGIMHALKGMSRERMRDWRMFSPLEAIRDALVIFASTRSACELEVDTSHVANVRGSPGGLTQVLLNLLANGADAMGGKGTLRISSETPPGMVVLTVTDQGGGLSEEARSRLFEPFFTTKTAGRGTGLGLYISRQLIDQMGGRLTLHTAHGGTTARIELPVVAG